MLNVIHFLVSCMDVLKRVFCYINLLYLIMHDGVGEDQVVGDEDYDDGDEDENRR